MKENSIQHKLAFYTSLITAVLGVIGLILYITCANGGYYNDLSGVTIMWYVLSILGSLVLIYTGNRYGNDSVFRLLHVLVSALFALGLMWLVNARVFSFAILLGSDLEASNTAAYTRLYLSIASMGTMIVACVLNTIGGFARYKAE